MIIKKYRIAVALSLVVTVVLSSCTLFPRVNNPLFEKQWYLDNRGDSSTLKDDMNYQQYVSVEPGVDIDAPEMWLTIKESKRKCGHTVIAVIDTGIDIRHKDLYDNIWKNDKEIAGDNIDNDGNGFVDDINGYNFCDGNSDVSSLSVGTSDNNHGTACAGVIGAINNDQGIRGIFDNKIMVLKVFRTSVETLSIDSVDRVIQAIEYAEHQGARVCNISFSSEKGDVRLLETMKRSNMLFVVSAGNGTPRGIDIKNAVFPASYNLENMITVANYNYGGFLDKSSNYGLGSVDVGAPGASIYTTLPGDRYGFYSGTSMSTAVVSGLAGALFAIDDTLSAPSVKTIIMSSVKQYSQEAGKITSGGMVNGQNAVKILLKRKE